MTNIKFEYMWRFMKENKCQADFTKSTDDLACTICKLLLINPHIGICGCKYCLECIITYLNGKVKVCPGDKKECKDELLDFHETISPDNKTSHQISKLLVKCPRQFCPFEDQLRRIENHEKCCEEQLIECPYITVGCKETRLTNGNINEHLRTGNVSHTRAMMSLIDRLQNEIRSTSRDVIETVLEMKHVESGKHELQMFAVQQKNYTDRLSEAIQSIMEELQVEQRLGRATNEMIDQIKADITNLRNDNKSMKVETSSLKTEVEILRAANSGLVELLGRRENPVAHVQTDDVKRTVVSDKATQWGTKAETSESPVNGVACVAGQLQDIYSDIAKQNLGKFVLSVDCWSAKRDSALDGIGKPIISEPFYSHKNGYKMCLAVYPGGSGVGKDTHLSVSLHLMRGQFDDHLTWPFKHTVRMFLVNQHTRQDHISCTVSFDQFPNHANWNKPVSHKNAGFTKSKLIELTELTGNPDLCRDDRIVIRCTVDLVGSA